MGWPEAAAATAGYTRLHRGPTLQRIQMDAERGPLRWIGRLPKCAPLPPFCYLRHILPSIRDGRRETGAGGKRAAIWFPVDP